MTRTGGHDWEIGSEAVSGSRYRLPWAKPWVCRRCGIDLISVSRPGFGVVLREARWGGGRYSRPVILRTLILTTARSTGSKKVDGLRVDKFEYRRRLRTESTGMGDCDSVLRLRDVSRVLHS